MRGEVETKCMTSPRKPSSPPLAVSLAIALVLHGSLLVSGTFRGTYDAYVHMFFGDHYARNWFSTWETRWYTGFTTVSYPPGTHQLLALLSKVVGLEAAFAIVQLTGIVVLIVGVFRMSKLWVGPEASRWAAFLAVVSTSIAEAVHVFGQLPTIIALGLLLNATPYVERFLRSGSLASLAMAIATLAATTACHHVTTLFGSVFFLGPIIARVVVDAWRSHETVSQVATSLLRTATFGTLLVTTLVIVVLPYWLWSSSDPISQVPIPHDSRANFLDNLNAGMVFWVIPWGVLLVIAGRSVSTAVRGRGWPLGMSIILLAVLGTGGTTPVPRFLLRGAFDILTLDRFTFWATIAILPFAGEIVRRLAERAVAQRSAKIAGGAFVVCLIGAFVFTVNLGQFRSLQPDSIDPNPIADFLEKDQHERWRYLTLGFGDQMAWVSAHTTATTVDGNYHSARRLPELVSRPVERLEGAKFRGMPGLGSLQQFVTTPERYNLKFVFSNDTFYDPLLFANGWHRVETLINGVVVWERADITPLPDTLPISELPIWQRILWGVLPLTAVAMAIVANTTAAMGFGSGATTKRQIVTATNGGTLRLRLVSPAWLRIATTALAAIALVAVLWEAPGSGAEDQVYDYYDDIDFGRFDQAWERLDPDTRPTAEQYLLERSVRDGLVDGYAKLDRLEIVEARIDGDSGEVDVAAHYVTSLTSWTVEQTYIVVNIEGEWLLRLAATESAIPVEQFARQTTVDYVDHGRRRVTTETSDYGDILDRPRISILDSRLVQYLGQWFIVGQLTNIDVDPADITVTGRLRGVDGDVLATYHAGIGTVHKVLPGETVPFRVAFEGVAAAGSMSSSVDEHTGVFDPSSTVQLTLEEEVASYEVEAKALVTGRNLERLAVSNVLIEQDERGESTLSATIANHGTETATIPMLAITMLDAQGEVLWVDSQPMSTALRSQRAGEVRSELFDVDRLEAVAIDGVTFDNGRAEEDGRSFESLNSIPVAGDSTVAAVAVTVTTFEREQ